ncbi:hypothetical protein L198_01842 [Cryptococcus wingfieldii CBS 7118]|uniref:Uncharacterized protein n=1 Tax=Cryptococcus wingfieldii CBS 7118 TaxID=1295528 RepID=A0A1E3JWC5_9TREE|nr:hypothetical protein L198_01842 [Cryptococcus wingfieldii CBS 7118]ODO05154.1 hypothetical protein L198_01842 [Cryptococcus wingfieldii CBS 7118]
MEYMELHCPEDPPPLAAPVPTNAAPSGAPQFPQYHQQQVPASSKPSTRFYALPPESQPLLNKRKSDVALAFGSYSSESSKAIKANRPLTVEEYFARAFAVREGNLLGLLGLLPSLANHMVTEAHALSASAHRSSQNQLIEATHKRTARNRKTMGVPTQQMAVEISAISEPQTPSKTPEWTTIQDRSVSLSRTASSSVASQDGLGVSTTSGASGVLAPAREQSLVVQRSTRAYSPSNPVPAKHAAPPSTSSASTRTAIADKAPSMSMAARIKEINRLGDELMQQYERMMKGK